MARETVEAWTDGACLGNPGPGGWGVLLRMGDKERELSGHEDVTTNNRMELMGAIAALEALKRPVKVVLHSDSSYVVKGMTEWVQGWQRSGWRSGREKKPVANRDLWERLLAAAAPHEVSWQWVRGHAGNVDNERVDRLATQAAARAREGDEVDVRVEVEARAGITCALAGKKDPGPGWCLRGPGNVGVHCVRGDGTKKCPHAFIVLERSSVKLQDRAGGTASFASTDATGPEARTLKGVLRALGE